MVKALTCRKALVHSAVAEEVGAEPQRVVYMHTDCVSSEELYDETVTLPEGAIARCYVCEGIIGRGSRERVEHG